MTQEELAVIKLKSIITTNQVALERTMETYRRLQREADEPAVYADSIFSGVDLLAEMERCWNHIKHLQKQIHTDEKAIFKHKIRYGDETEF